MSVCDNHIALSNFNILKLVKENSPIEAITIEMKSNLKRYKTSKSYREALNGSYVYGSNWDRAVLLLIEYFSSDESKQPFISLGNHLHLEHILPRTSNEAWDVSADVKMTH